MPSSICYACGAPKTSVEHVPPRCLFPEKKDLPIGVDLRRQLITVPSCETHNSMKSHDDEYLLFALVMNIPNNGIGDNHFLSKVMRAIAKNPHKISRFTERTVPLIVENVETGVIENTVALRVDLQRLKHSLAMTGRALYFHHFGTIWKGTVSAYPHFVLALTESNAQELNEPLENMASAAEEMFKSEPKFGDNPEVFFYQVACLPGTSDAIMFLHFYEGSKVSLIFKDVKGVVQ